MSPGELLAEIRRYAEDKKAGEVVEIDLREVLGYTDWFVICSGNTSARPRRSTTPSWRGSSTSTTCFRAAWRG
ncbi:MAG TPA: RsfS/YbeB/iojap family protein [Solirubrobacteraceae bacterium]|nr:RsfS/YbeB/iojap family protein [Solirubrobacteraceae bacterium]